VALLPGVGFDVVPSDCLAAKLAAALPAAVELELAFAAVGGSWSRGTLKTVIEGLPHLGAIRRDGRIVAVPAAWDVKTIPFSCGPRRAVTIPWGDVATAYHTTGIPNVRVYVAMPPRQIAWLRRLRPLARWLAARPVKRRLQALVEARVTGPDQATRERARMCLWGRAAAAAPPAGDGAAVTLTLDVPEGYSFTAVAAVECVRRLLAGAVEPGAWTPARAFGAGFVDELPGVTVGAITPAPAVGR
jgi:saccharopine dehydrogenase (NAD+, L-lysine-forming)